MARKNRINLISLLACEKMFKYMYKEIGKMAEKDYYRRIKTVLLYSKEYNNLMGKSEIGEEISQYATVDLASTLSECMAEELGCNSQKASVVAMCKGLIFSPYGKAGMACIKQLAEAEHLEINEQQICKNVVNKVLVANNFKMTPDLEESISGLFKESSNDRESEIVKSVYKMLNDIFILRKSSISMQTKLNNKTFDILEDAIEESKRTGKISVSPKLERLKQIESYRQEEKEMTSEQKNSLTQLWQEYKKHGLSTQEIVSSLVTEKER